MNIFLLIDKYIPLPLSCARMMYDLSLEIKSQGHNPFIFTVDDTLTSQNKISKEKGITTIRSFSPNLKISNKMIRLYREMTISNRIIKYNYEFLNKNHCDLLIVYSPTIFWTKTIKTIKRINRCHTYLILRDLFPQWLVDTKIIKNQSLVHKFLSFKEKQLYSSSDTIGVQSPSNLDYFERNFNKNNFNLEVLYNWTKIDPRPIKNMNFRKKYKLIDKTIFVYAGNIGFAQDLMKIVNLAKSLIDNIEIHFVIIGSGIEKEMISKIIKRENITNITLLDSVDEKDLMNILIQCDVGIISLSNKLKTENIPGKLLTYSKASLPIIATTNILKDLKTMIESTKCGFLIDNGSNLELIEKSLFLHNNPKVRKKFGKNSNTLLQKYFNVKNTLKQILSNYKNKNEI